MRGCTTEILSVPANVYLHVYLELSAPRVLLLFVLWNWSIENIRRRSTGGNRGEMQSQEIARTLYPGRRPYPGPKYLIPPHPRMYPKPPLHIVVILLSLQLYLFIIFDSWMLGFFRKYFRCFLIEKLHTMRYIAETIHVPEENKERTSRKSAFY